MASKKTFTTWVAVAAALAMIFLFGEMVHATEAGSGSGKIISDKNGSGPLDETGKDKTDSDPKKNDKKQKSSKTLLAKNDKVKKAKPYPTYGKFGKRVTIKWGDYGLSPQQIDELNEAKIKEGGQKLVNRDLIGKAIIQQSVGRRHEKRIKALENRPFIGGITSSNSGVDLKELQEIKDQIGDIDVKTLKEDVDDIKNQIGDTNFTQLKKDIENAQILDSAGNGKAKALAKKFGLVLKFDKGKKEWIAVKDESDDWWNQFCQIFIGWHWYWYIIVGGAIIGLIVYAVYAIKKA